MANDYVKINELITEVKHNPFRGLCEQTYINDSIYAEFARRKDLKWVKIQDLRLKYKWTNDETQMMYDKTADGWTDGSNIYRLFDFGKGENKVVKEDGIDKLFHEPQHDHIVSRDEAKRLGWTDKQINHPSNIQYISAIQNFMKRNFTKEMWRAVSPTIEQLFKDE
jgi:Txe/YoeB family toxin of Txe-Axe toxin-antitoxin module